MGNPVRAWARAVGIVYHGGPAVRSAYEDALHARGLPTCLNPHLIKEPRRA